MCDPYRDVADEVGGPFIDWQIPFGNNPRLQACMCLTKHHCAGSALNAQR
nr:hypothetical protein JVH1_1039 [Rhodococcus sp. JVH1]